ncbi:MAG: RsmB/NOP family class I SAM-dependent RNA methyltransferase [Jatrophihabitans sp.]|uniref:RsmB/NOP family class I SAM-dependent RNA methyltransferase n=1 Tax=Jatrophihabitans sp. TaxID=1932789 RepID=UPI003F7E5679
MSDARGARRSRSGTGPPGRPRRGAPSRPPADDPARRVAYDLLRAVSADGAYANLALPALIADARLDERDAALATELGYGTVRATGTLDAVLAACIDRDLAEVEPAVLDLLRLGAYQVLRTRVPSHAAVATTVDLARTTEHGRAAGFVNAVLRRVTTRGWDAWCDELAAGDPTRRLALQYAHPTWIVEAFAAALGEDAACPPAQASRVAGDDLAGGQSASGGELEAALAADDERPVTHLVAWPGRSTTAELVAESGGEPGPWSPYAVRTQRGDPGRLEAVRERRAGVQDEGSQLCAVALASAPLDGPDTHWLDLCAGPGGKAALLAALAAERGATLHANELRPHRAELVRRVTEHWGVEVSVGDGRELAGRAGGYDRVLLDAPCTGLGALRRRPEARWRRDPADVPQLAELQRELLAAALRLARPGGVVAYVTCSPHLAETRDVVAGHDLLDARPLLPGVPMLGDGPTVQLWPHRHGTDAMFLALIRRPMGEGGQ